MKNTKVKIKRRISFSLFATMVFVSIGFFASNIVTAIAKADLAKAQYQQEYIQEVNKFASDVNFSFDLQTLSAQQEPQIIYNFVSVVSFKNETDLLNNEYKQSGKTNAQIFEEMFNTGEYSVNKYYEVISNGKLDLKTIFVKQTSAELSYERNYFIDKYKRDNDYGYYLDNSSNKVVENSNGYDAEKTQTISVYGFNIPLEGITEKYFRGVQFLNPAFESVMSYIEENNFEDESDFNADGQIDSISVIYFSSNQQQTAVRWNDLLWAHAWTIPKELIEELLSNQIYTTVLNQNGIQTVNFKRTINGKTLYVGAHMVNEFRYDGTESPVTHLPKNNTDIHELGHVLGWPDYYLYSNQTSLNAVPVDVWDVMANNHLDIAQYPTTYSRQSQGWMPQTAVQEITKNGVYSLQPVNYEEVNNLNYNGRAIAFKINHPTDPTQSVYVEYRKQTQGSFDGNTSQNIGLQDGIIVYRVDEGFYSPGTINGNDAYKNPGNSAAKPFNLYVFRNSHSNNTSDEYSVKNAPLNENNTVIGGGMVNQINGKTITSQNITWQVYDKTTKQAQDEINTNSVSEIDSGIVITFVGIDEQSGELSFRVKWDYFGVNPEDVVEAESFQDRALYNALVEKYSTEEDMLLKTDIKELDYIDLSNFNIISIKGLELLEFKQGAVIDLRNNKLTSIAEMEVLLENNNLMFNAMFNNIPYFIKDNENIILGFQNISADKLLINKTLRSLNNITFDNFNDYQTYYNLQYQNFDLIAGENSLSTTETITFSFISRHNNFKTQSTTLSISSVSTLQNVKHNVGNALTLQELLVFENASYEDFEYEILNEQNQVVTFDGLLNQLGIVNFVLNISQNGELLNTLTLSLEVVDEQPPSITLNGSDKIYLFVGDAYAELGAVGEDNFDNNLQVVVSGQVNTNVSGQYELNYYTIDSSGNTSQVIKRTVFVINITAITGIELNVFAVKVDISKLFTFSLFSFTDYTYEVLTEIKTNQIGVQNTIVRFTLKQDPSFSKDMINHVVVKDKEKPVLITAKSNEFVYIDSVYSMPTVTVRDNYDSASSIKIEESGSVNLKKVGVYTLTFSAKDSSGNVADALVVTVNVIHKPFDNLKVKQLSKDKVITLNTTLTFEVDLTEYAEGFYNHNSTFIWYVNGFEVARSKGTTFNHTFKKLGENVVEVKAINFTVLEKYEVSSNAQQFKVEVTTGGFAENYLLPIVGVGAVLVFVGVIASLVIKKKRRLF